MFLKNYFSNINLTKKNKKPHLIPIQFFPKTCQAIFNQLHRIFDFITDSLAFISKAEGSNLILVFNYQESRLLIIKSNMSTYLKSLRLNNTLFQQIWSCGIAFWRTAKASNLRIIQVQVFNPFIFISVKSPTCNGMLSTFLYTQAKFSLLKGLQSFFIEDFTQKCKVIETD